WTNAHHILLLRPSQIFFAPRRSRNSTAGLIGWAPFAQGRSEASSPKHFTERRHVPTEFLVRRGLGLGGAPAGADAAHDLQRADRVLAQGRRRARRARGSLLPSPYAAVARQAARQRCRMPLSRPA